MADRIKVELRIPRAIYNAANKKAEEGGIKLEQFIIGNIMGGTKTVTKEVVKEVIKEIPTLECVNCANKEEVDETKPFRVKSLWSRK